MKNGSLFESLRENGEEAYHFKEEGVCYCKKGMVETLDHFEESYHHFDFLLRH